MGYYEIAKEIIADFSFFVAVPSIVSFFAPNFGYGSTSSFFISLFVMWVLSIELRLRDLGRKKK